MSMKSIMAFVAFMTVIGMTSAVEVQISAGNGQETTAHTMGGFSRINPSVFAETFNFDFTGDHKHTSGSINVVSDTMSLNATRTDDGHTVHVKGIFSMPNYTEEYEQTREE